MPEFHFGFLQEHLSLVRIFPRPLDRSAKIAISMRRKCEKKLLIYRVAAMHYRYGIWIGRAPGNDANRNDEAEFGCIWIFRSCPRLRSRPRTRLAGS